MVLSFDGPRVPGAFLNEYAVLQARAAIEPGEAAWELRYRVERIGGVGPWRPAAH